MHEEPAISGQAVNFSYEAPMTVRQVVDKILAHMHQEDLEPQVLGTASNEIPHQYLDAARARETLSWRPSFDIDKGMKRTIKWYEEHFVELATERPGQ